MKNFAVFDLDGTLLHTLEGIKKAINRGLAYYNYPYEYDCDMVKTFIGNGARRLFLLATKNKEFNDKLEIQYQKFLDFYAEEQCNSRPYDEVISTLNEMSHLGIKLIVYTNKPNKLAQEVVKRALKGVKFDAVLGQLDSYPTKPDVTMLNECLSKFNLNNMNGIYVGDSLTDNLTAMNAKLDFIFVTYGYCSLEDSKKINGARVTKFSEILDYLK